MNKTFFTSDNHFFHKNMLKYLPESRRFCDVMDMNERMIEQWNSQVGDNDTVYCLGDLSFGDPYKTNKILNELKGNIVLIVGNHDHEWLSSMTKKRLSGIYHYKMIKIDKIKVVLFHYPIAKWDCQDYGSFHLYGHVHGSLTIPGRAMDVGVDTKNNCGLYSWEDVKGILQDKPIIGHH